MASGKLSTKLSQQSYLIGSRYVDRLLDQQARFIKRHAQTRKDPKIWPEGNSEISSPIKNQFLNGDNFATNTGPLKGEKNE